MSGQGHRKTRVSAHNCRPLCKCLRSSLSSAPTHPGALLTRTPPMCVSDGVAQHFRFGSTEKPSGRTPKRPGSLVCLNRGGRVCWIGSLRYHADGVLLHRRHTTGRVPFPPHLHLEGGRPGSAPGSGHSLWESRSPVGNGLLGLLNVQED